MRKESFFRSQQILQFPLWRLTIKSLINLRTLIYPLFSLIIPSNSRCGGLDDPFLRFLYFRGYFCSSWQPWSSLSLCYKSWRSLKHVSGKKRKKKEKKRWKINDLPQLIESHEIRGRRIDVTCQINHFSFFFFLVFRIICIELIESCSKKMSISCLKINFLRYFIR